LGGGEELAIPPSPEKGSMMGVSISMYAPFNFEFYESDIFLGG
jgi:hypothetical protein